MSDDQLRRLLGDAVSDIEPHDRIDELRASVRPSSHVVPMARHRSWYAGAGIVATATVIGVVAFVTSLVGDPAGLGPAGDGDRSPTAIATDTAAVQPHRAFDARRSVTVYYLGRGGQGAVLVPQPTAIRPGSTALDTAVTALSAAPLDADHRTPWQPGWLLSARVVDGTLAVELGTAPTARPARLSARAAYETVQAAIFTLQGAGQTHAPVRFLRHGDPVATVLGVPTAQSLAADRAWDTVTPVAITRPSADRDHLRRGALVVTGIGTAPSGSRISLVVLRGSTAHGKVVLRRTIQVPAPSRPDGIASWRARVDTSHLAPGRYTLRASTTGFSGGQSATDTRVVVLR